MPLSPEEILDKIKNLNLIDALKFLAAQKISSFIGTGFAQIKKVVQDKQNKEKYAFVPNKKQALQLMEFGGHPEYKTVKLLLPAYSYIDLIRTGLLLRKYMDAPTPENQDEGKRIKAEIQHRPNGQKLLTIVRLATTPYFSMVLNYLYQLLQKSYTHTQLAEKFDEIVNSWDDSYLPVKSTQTQEEIEEFCRKQVTARKKLFFILGMKQAAANIQRVIEHLKADGFFEQNNYEVTVIASEIGVDPRLEVTIHLKAGNDSFFE